MPDSAGEASEAHHELVAQPHEQEDEGPIADAEAEAERMRSDDRPLGRPGRPLNRRSPFFVGMVGAAGVAVTYALGVSLIALTVSLPVGIATAVFFTIYQAVENYLLAPKVMGRVVQVPDVVTVAAVLIGGTLLG